MFEWLLISSIILIFSTACQIQLYSSIFRLENALFVLFMTTQDNNFPLEFFLRRLLTTFIDWTDDWHNSFWFFVRWWFIAWQRSLWDFYHETTSELWLLLVVHSNRLFILLNRGAKQYYYEYCWSEVCFDSAEIFFWLNRANLKKVKDFIFLTKNERIRMKTKRKGAYKRFFEDI